MRQILGCSRSSDGRGFTLLELLVVLAITAGVVGLVGAGIGSAVTRASDRAAEQALVSMLHSLPQEAAKEGRLLRIDANGLRSRLEEWPSNWNLSIASVLEYGPTGQAGGGTVFLKMPDGKVVEWRIEPVGGQAMRLR
jgi:prepilin-type N-terminal cleavage/methylation domain-containing protein